MVNVKGSKNANFNTIYKGLKSFFNETWTIHLESNQCFYQQNIYLKGKIMVKKGKEGLAGQSVSITLNFIYIIIVS